jgi:hypothetical protein
LRPGLRDPTISRDEPRLQEPPTAACLPQPPTPEFGRDEVLIRVLSLIEEYPVITVAGIGGAGKRMSAPGKPEGHCFQ